MNKNRKENQKIWIIVVGVMVLMVVAFLLGKFAFSDNGLTSLPRPEASTEGQRGELGIDKHINEDTIDNYLGRSDAVYRDLRMLVDPADYDAIGGDAFLSGFVNGFEVIPFPYLVNVTSLPETVGSTYDGTTLFLYDGNNYAPLYEESMEILETLFPKDKVIFLMCGGGGYAGSMKNMLVALGWDESKIYNVGGYWYYDGNNNVEVMRKKDDGNVIYDFYKVPYHSIDFGTLDKKNN